MRLNTWIGVGILSFGVVLSAVGEARATTITVNQLFGKWSGTFTPTSGGELVSSGIASYDPSNYYGVPQDYSLTFTAPAGSGFAFGVAGTSISVPGTTSGGVVKLISSSFSGDSLSWETEFFDTTTAGKTVQLTTVNVSATVAVDSSNAKELQLTGARSYSWAVTSLPSISGVDAVVAVDGTFSVTSGSSTGSTGSTGSVVPLPASASSSFAMLGALGSAYYLRSRRRLGSSH